MCETIMKFSFVSGRVTNYVKFLIVLRLFPLLLLWRRFAIIFLFFFYKSSIKDEFMAEIL